MNVKSVSYTTNGLAYKSTNNKFNNTNSNPIAFRGFQGAISTEINEAAEVFFKQLKKVAAESNVQVTAKDTVENMEGLYNRVAPYIHKPGQEIVPFQDVFNNFSERYVLNNEFKQK